MTRIHPNWIRYTGNPILECSNSGWDSHRIEDSVVVFNPLDGKYYMLYNGEEEAYSYDIGLATGPTPLGPFEKYSGNPVIRREPGSWNEKTMRVGSLLRVGNKWRCYAGGEPFSGKGGIGYWESNNFKNWTPCPDNPLPTPYKVGSPNVRLVNGRFIGMFTDARTKTYKICCLESDNGKTFHDIPDNPLVAPQAGTLYSNQCVNPCFFICDGEYHIVLEGNPGTPSMARKIIRKMPYVKKNTRRHYTWRIFLARWNGKGTPVKVETTPYLNLGSGWDEGGVANPDIYLFEDTLYFYYGGVKGVRWSIGVAYQKCPCALPFPPR